jgi:hypothetical protein
MLTALYHSNAPTINKNSERDTIYTYPTSRQLGFREPRDFMNLLTIGSMITKFIEILIFCL